MRATGVLLGLAVAGILFAQEAATGDSVRGRALFEGSAGCVACHRVFYKGSRLGGPDLSDVGSRRTPDVLRKSMLDPEPEVQPQDKSYRVVLRDGTVVTGRLLNQDQFSLQMLDGKERLVSFQKSNLREYGFVQTPAMPSFKDKLNA